MPRTHADRLRALVGRIEEWEESKWAPIEDSEELILDIKQCLESILLEEPAWVINRDGDIEPAHEG